MSILNSTERTWFSSAYTGFFSLLADTTIIVYKEPVRTVIDNPTDPFMFGMNSEGSQNGENFTYSEVTGVYPAIFRSPESMQGLVQNAEIANLISNGMTTIKVNTDCRDFIQNGKTDRIMIEGVPYYLNSDYAAKPYMGGRYWMYALSRTK
jgi:hypothetical protein